MIGCLQGFEHLLESLGLGRLKFNSSHSISHHKTHDDNFEEMHDAHHIHEHTHQRAARTAGKEDSRKLYLLQHFSLSHEIYLNKKYVNMCVCVCVS